MKRLVVVAGLVAFAACGGQNPGTSPECRPQCVGRTCGDDGCGGSCGSCPEGQVCSPSTFSCVCPVEDDAAFCQRMGTVCGTATGNDLCGRPRTVACDLCARPTTCDPQTGQCACTPETDEAFCRRLGDVCGERTADDNCGASRTVECRCGAGESCNAATQTCEVCLPETNEQFCRRLGKLCGTASAVDNCSAPRTVGCAFCGEGQTCDARAEACVCVPESDAQFCAAQGRQCGPATGLDRCGRTRDVASCGNCAGTDECDAASGRCGRCRPESDAAFCARHEKVCGIYEDLDNCIIDRVVDCGSCHNGKLCTDNLCAFPGGPTNDDCSSPKRVAIVDGTGSISGSLDAALADAEASCGGATGPDVVYAFTLTEPQQVRIDFDSTSLVAVSVRSACDDAASEVGCAMKGSGALRLGTLAAGTWYLWVDAASASTGPFTATLHLSPPPPVPDNDLCSLPEPLNFTGTTATIVGTTEGAHDERVSSCASHASADVFYSFELTSPGSLQVRVTSRTPLFEPVVSVLSACSGTGSELGCDNGLQALVAFGNLPAGHYLIAVDSIGAVPGAFELDLETSPAVTNDTCASPRRLPIDPVTKMGIVYSDTTFGTADTVNSCDSVNTGPDLVFQFDVPPGENQSAQLTATAAPGSNFKPQLSVRALCDQVATELGCNAAFSGSNGLLLSHLPPGSYYAWLDGATRWDAGAFSLSVTLTSPTTPDNDSCATPGQLVFDPATDTATVQGTTVAASDETSASCGGAGGNDVAFRFTLPTAARVNARVARALTSGFFEPMIYIRGVCDRVVPGDEQACDPGAFGVASVNLATLPAGDWYVIVDSANGTEGDFELQVSAVALVDNFTCATAQPIHLGSARTVTIRSDTTLGYDNQTTSTCAATVSGGHEVIFSFEIPSGPRQDVTIEAEQASGASTEPIVTVRRTCAAPGSEIGCASNASGATASLTLPSLEEGTYFIWIDTPSSHANGPFNLTITMADAASAPANDACSAPETIALDTATGVGTATGDTSAAGPDETGSCSALDGRDLIYAVTLRGPSDLQVDVTALPGSTLQPVVYVRSSCGAASSELGCNAGTATGSASLIVPRLPQGTWYIVVDGASGGASGAFEMQVTAALPTPLATNDACRAAQAIQVDTTTHEVTVTGSTLAGLDNEAGGCAAAGHPHSGADLVYVLTLADPARVVATVTRDASTPGYQPAVYIAQSCSAADHVAGELGCGNAANGAARANARVVPAGDVFIVVDGQDGSAGRFSLTVKLGAPGTNDTCTSAMPIAIDPTTRSAVNFGDTSDASDDDGSSCNGTTGTGRDLVYSITVPPATLKDIDLQVSAMLPMQPTVSVRRTCTAMSSEIGCVLPSSTVTTSTATLSLLRVTPGTYFVWVDGTSSVSKGEFDLRVTMTDSAPGPANDTCSAPTSIALDLATGRATLTGSTRLSANDDTGTCATFGGGDNVYLVHLDAPAKLTAKVTPDSLSSPYYYPAAYLRAVCTSSAASDELACARPQNGQANLIASVLGAGDYFLFVDGAVGTNGDYTLEVQKSAPVYGENCLGAEELQFVGNTAVVNGDTTSALADSDGTCGGDHGPDLVYSFTTGSAQAFSAEMVFASTSKQPTLYLRSSCRDAATEIVCGAANSYTNRTRIDVARLPAGTWYLWADSNSSMSTIQRGPFTLTVNLTPPPAAPVNDICSGAEELQFNQATHKVTVSAQTTYAVNDYDGTCANASGPDMVYTFTTTAEQKLTVKVTPSSTTPSFQPVVYLRSDCNRSSASNELSCATKDLGSGMATLVVNDLPAQSFWIVVDGAAGTHGSFTLEAELSAPVAGPANESCANVQPLTLSGSTLQVSGTTLLAQNEGSGSCASGLAPDVVYSITTTAAQKIVATVTPAAGFYPAVYIRKTCDAKTTGAELACASSGGSSTPTTATAKYAPAGTYWIWIDGGSSYAATWSGSFTLDLRLDAPVLPPANDGCAAPATLEPGTTLIADTSDASNDFGAFTSPLCSSTLSVSTPDVVYVFTPATSGSFSVTVTPTGWDAVVWVGSGSCGAAGSCVAYRDAGGSGSAETVSFAGTAGQPYYVYVEGYSASSAGPFSIAVQ